jgi:hypothetical protein
LIFQPGARRTLSIMSKPPLGCKSSSFSMLGQLQGVS